MFVRAIDPVAAEFTQRISCQAGSRDSVADGSCVPALGGGLPGVTHCEALLHELGLDWVWLEWIWFMRALSSRGKTGLRRYVHFQCVGSVVFNVQIIRATRVNAGVGTVQMAVHFDCALTVHFISDGFIPRCVNQLKNQLLRPLVRCGITCDETCSFKPLDGPAQLVDGGCSTLDALVGLDIQLFRNGLVRYAPLDPDNAARVVHERPDAEHIDLTRQHG